MNPRNPIVVLGRGRIQWARNALCKKYKAPTSKKGRVQKHMLKGSKQNRQSGKPSGARSTKGPPADKKKGGLSKPTRPGRRQPKATRKKLQVFLLHKVILQIIAIGFLKSQMTLNQRITLKLYLVNCEMIFHFLIQSLNSLLHMRISKVGNGRAAKKLLCRR